jgi:hypothetical protein
MAARRQQAGAVERETWGMSSPPDEGSIVAHAAAVGEALRNPQASWYATIDGPGNLLFDQ